MVYNVHLFPTAAAAQAAIDTIDSGEGFPLPGGRTLTYTRYYAHEGQYYIIADEVTRKYIAEEEELEIMAPE